MKINFPKECPVFSCNCGSDYCGLIYEGVEISSKRLILRATTSGIFFSWPMEYRNSYKPLTQAAEDMLAIARGGK